MEIIKLTINKSTVFTSMSYNINLKSENNELKKVLINKKYIYFIKQCQVGELKNSKMLDVLLLQSHEYVL